MKKIKFMENNTDFEYKNLKEEDISWEYFRSSGPGGQKVNKTSSGVRLRLHLEKSLNFSEEEKVKIKEAYPKRITEEGDLIVASQTSRSQKINREASLEKAEALINKALAPTNERIATKAPKAQKEKRLREKRVTSNKKELRKKVEF